MSGSSVHIQSQVTGMVLAGGGSSRMHSITDDKAWLPWQGKPLIAHVIERLIPQVGTLSINVNADLADYQAFNLPLWPDQLDEDWEKRPGPMAGMLAGLRQCQTPWLAIVPCDAPLLPANLVKQLYECATLTGAKIVIAATRDGNKKLKDHPVFCLLHTSMQDSLYAYLKGGDRKIMLWMQQHAFERVVFEDSYPFIMNVNTPEAFNELQKINYTMK